VTTEEKIDWRRHGAPILAEASRAYVPPAPPAGFGVRDIVGILRRRRGLVLGLMVVATLLAGVVLLFVTPRYTAETLVMVEGRARNVAGVEAVVPGLPGDAEAVEGEVQILRSRELAERVVTRLDLFQNPEFDGSPAWTAARISPARLEEVVDRFRDRLRVSQQGRSRVMSVRFSSMDPELAARAANTIGELYLTSQLESKLRATQSASSWLDERVRDLSAQVEASERAVEEFRRSSGLLQGESLRADLVKDLRTQETELQRRLAELSSSYGARHPKVVAIRAELANVRYKLGAELNLNAAQARLRLLERDAESNRALLGTYLTRLKETGSQKDIKGQQPDARIVSRAAVPADPSFPKTWLILALVAAGSGFAGVLAAFAAEQMDSGLRNVAEMDRVEGLQSLGFSPRVAAPDAAADLVGYVLEYPRSAYAESLRTLLWSLNLTLPDNPSRCVLITSAEPEEGKTSIVACLAALKAAAGQRVLVVDADARRPALAQAFSVTAGAGLAEVLMGRARLDEVIVRDPRTGVDLLAAGAAPPDMPRWLEAPGMAAMLATLQTRYDLVLLDSPPLHVAVDSCVLARIADTTVLVVRWQATRREAVEAAVSQLRDAGARLAGGVLTLVDLDRYAPYGYSGYGAYRSYIGRYYSEPAQRLRIREWRDLRQPLPALIRHLAEPRQRREFVRDVRALVRRGVRNWRRS
jgi:capsular exopolysaccharide synthesis family protein